MLISLQKNLIKVTLGFLTFLNLGWSAQETFEQSFQKNIYPILESKCFKCHDEDVQKGDLRLDIYNHKKEFIKDFKIWEKVYEQIESDEMPPQKPLLTDLERDQLLNWTHHFLDNIDWSHLKSPGYVVMSRLSNQEYNNSVRDLLGIDLQLQHFLGKDSQGMSGYSHDRDALELTQSQFEKYLKLSDRITDAFFALDDKPTKLHFESEDMLMSEARSKTATRDDFTGYFLNRGQMTLYDTLSIPKDGYYKLNVRALSNNKVHGSGFVFRLNNEEKLHSHVQPGQPIVVSEMVFLEAGDQQMTFNIYEGPLNEQTKPSSEMEAGFQKEIKKIDLKFKRGDLKKNILPKFHDLFRAMNGTRRYLVQLIALDEKNYTRYYKDTHRKYQTSQKTIISHSTSLAKTQKLEVDEFFETYFPGYTTFRDQKLKHEALIKQKMLYVTQATNKTIGIDWVSFEGPLLPKGMQRNDLIITLNEKYDQTSTFHHNLRHLLRRAFRRPIQEQELNKYVSFYQSMSKTKSHHQAFRLTLKAILSSPYFIMHYKSPAQQTQKDQQLDDYELASRLSYFLWRSMPDEHLFELAAKQRLRDPNTLKLELRRMLRDPKAKVFISNFAEQWLGYGELGKQQKPDPERFPQFTQNMIEDMKEETTQFLWYIFQNDLPLSNLLNANFSFINESLARHYDIKNIAGPEFRMVSLEGTHRSGLLGMGSILTATSSPLRTSPVNRGMWVIESLLGDHLPEPPADVEPLPDNAGEEGAKTLREILLEHREREACAKCHDKIDPIGFGLENFDPTGQFRTRISGVKIDNSGELPGQIKFKGLHGLKQYILDHRLEDFHQNIIEKVLSFALGRKLEHYDQASIQQLVQQNKDQNTHALQLLESIITSYPFLFYRQQESSI